MSPPLTLFLDSKLSNHRTSLFSLFEKIVIVKEQSDIFFCGTPTFLIFDDAARDVYNAKSTTCAYTWSNDNDYDKIEKLTLKFDNDSAANVIVFDVDDTLITVSDDVDVPLCTNFEYLTKLKSDNPTYLIGIWSHGSTTHINNTKKLYEFDWDFIITRKESYTGPKFAAYLLYWLNATKNICSLNSAILIDDTKSSTDDYSVFIHIKSRRLFSLKVIYDELTRLINGGINKYT